VREHLAEIDSQVRPADADPVEEPADDQLEL